MAYEITGPTGIAPTATAVIKNSEVTYTSRDEIDLTGVTYTVPAGKQFMLFWFGGTTKSPAAVKYRLKVDGETKFVIMLSGGQGSTAADYGMATPIVIATEGQVVKITYDPDYKNGSGWAGFVGQVV